MHYYPHHIGDYRAATAHLSNEEDLAYRRLLEMYYDTEQPIPLETQWVARRLRVGSESVQVVLNDFFEQQQDGWHHARCEEEIKEYAARADRARKNGKNGGRRKAAPAKAENPVGSQSVPSGNPEVTQPIANQEPRTKNHIPPKPPEGGEPKLDAMHGFAEFWATWPSSIRKVGKASCETKWKTKKLAHHAETIIAHVKAMKTSEQWTSGYEPSPMTYINQRRWEDGVAGAAEDDQFAGVM
jgi:uncharacterized protein YdaU (DUF1376 family)